MDEPAATRPLSTSSTRGAITLLLGTVVLLALWKGREILLLSLFSVLIAIAMSYPIKWLMHVVNRGAAVLATCALIVIALAGLGLLVVPTLVDQSRQLALQAPIAIDHLEKSYQRILRSKPVSRLSDSGKVDEKVKSGTSKIFEDATSKILPAAAGLVSLFSAFVLIFVLAAFLAHQPDTYRRGIRSLVPKRYESAFEETWHRLGDGLTRWMGGILVSMTIMGGLTAVGLLIAGIDSWLLLGFLTFLGTFVPYAGAIASAVPGLLLGLAKSPTHFVYASIVYLGIHIVEGYIVQPIIMKKAVELKPALLLVGQVFIGLVFGIFGVVIATPLLVCVQILVQTLYVERTLGKGQVVAMRARSIS